MSDTGKIFVLINSIDTGETAYAPVIVVGQSKIGLLTKVFEMYDSLRYKNFSDFDKYTAEGKALQEMLERHEDWGVGTYELEPIAPHHRVATWQLFICEGSGYYKD